MTGGRGDIVTVFLVDAFGGAAIVVSLLDFFVLQGRSLSGADPVGLVVFLLGVVLILSALRALRRQYTVRVETSKSQTLVRSGPYRVIRDPIYLGLILIFFSASIAWTSGYGALITFPTIPLLLRRIGMEEKAMALRFGDEYASYRQKTRRLVPFVY